MHVLTQPGNTHCNLLHLFMQLVDTVNAASRDTRTGGVTYSVFSGPFQAISRCSYCCVT